MVDRRHDLWRQQVVVAPWAHNIDGGGIERIFDVRGVEFLTRPGAQRGRDGASATGSARHSRCGSPGSLADVGGAGPHRVVKRLRRRDVFFKRL
jgi:hypothetical protein